MPNYLGARSDFWRKVLARLKTLSATLAPPLGWIYLFLASYVILGSFIFPEWWKRFLWGGGAFDPRYWSIAGEYLVNLAKTGHPLAIVVILLALGVVGWLLVTAGRVGIADVPQAIPAPSRTSIVLITVILIVTVMALAAVKTEYKTPAELLDEMTQKNDDARDRLVGILRSLSRPTAPRSGFFLYLDPPRLVKTYNTLQNELTSIGDKDRRGWERGSRHRLTQEHWG